MELRFEAKICLQNQLGTPLLLLQEKSRTAKTAFLLPSFLGLKQKKKTGAADVGNELLLSLLLLRCLLMVRRKKG